MDHPGKEWYFSCMTVQPAIPVFNLFGETEAFPDVVHCERLFVRASEHGWTISPHRHDRMAQLFHIETGKALTRVDEETWTLEGDSFLYVPVQIVHGFRFDPGTEGRVLSFPLPVMTGMGPAHVELGPRLFRPVSGPATQQMAALIEQFAETYDGAGIFRAQRLIGLAQTLLAMAAEWSAASPSQLPSSRQRLHQFDALLTAHHSDGWRVIDYATALSITPGQLSRICRETMGMNATTYIGSFVMTEACRMLAFTRVPVSEIGYRLGFDDPSYFTRRFRTVCGETPTQYRARFVA